MTFLGSSPEPRRELALNGLRRPPPALGRVDPDHQRGLGVAPHDPARLRQPGELRLEGDVLARAGRVPRQVRERADDRWPGSSAARMASLSAGPRRSTRSCPTPRPRRRAGASIARPLLGGERPARWSSASRRHDHVGSGDRWPKMSAPSRAASLVGRHRQSRGRSPRRGSPALPRTARLARTGRRGAGDPGSRSNRRLTPSAVDPPKSLTIADPSGARSGSPALGEPRDEAEVAAASRARRPRRALRASATPRELVGQPYVLAAGSAARHSLGEPGAAVAGARVTRAAPAHLADRLTAAAGQQRDAAPRMSKRLRDHRLVGGMGRPGAQRGHDDPGARWPPAPPRPRSSPARAASRGRRLRVPAAVQRQPGARGGMLERAAVVAVRVAEGAQVLNRRPHREDRAETVARSRRTPARALRPTPAAGAGRPARRGAPRRRACARRRTRRPRPG